MHCWNTFDARKSHGQTRTHKTHHGPNLGEATTFPLIVHSAPLHEAHIQMTFLFQDSQMGVSKFPKLGLLQLWSPITFCADLRLKWGLKKSRIPCQKLFKNMLHITYTQGNQVDSRLLVVGSQIANLTSDLSFGHNLCFEYPNGSCKLILYIYVSTSFQWYKEIINPMGFDPCNRSLKNRESTETPISKMGAHLRVWVFILTLSHTPMNMRCETMASLFAIYGILHIKGI